MFTQLSTLAVRTAVVKSAPPMMPTPELCFFIWMMLTVASRIHENRLRRTITPKSPRAPHRAALLSFTRDRIPHRVQMPRSVATVERADQ